METLRILDYISDLVFPNRCPCCNYFIEWDKLICQDCQCKIPFTSSRLAGSRSFDGEQYYSHCVAGAYYDGIVRDGIIRLKIDFGINFAKFFAELLTPTIISLGISDEIDMIIPIPMSRTKLSKRGYNQAYVFAKVISDGLHKPIFPKILTKLENCHDQHSLSFRDRQINAKTAYEFSGLNAEIAGKTILLCDDVITTGSTLNECARLLKEKGAEQVYCAVIAETPFDRRMDVAE